MSYAAYPKQINTTLKNPLTPVLRFIKVAVIILILLILLSFVFKNQVKCAFTDTREAGYEVPNGNAECGCESKTSGIYNMYSQPGFRCCPTTTLISKGETKYCAKLEIGDNCTWNEQCVTSICHTENSDRGRCSSKR